MNIKLNNICTKALLDTGSCVSLISETFYRNCLSEIQIEPLTTVLNIECADGQQLPYIGCIEAEINIEVGLGQAKQSITNSCYFRYQYFTYFITGL